ncbi:hypothetical protein [Idiomarina sp.]|uniref:hypothetical protein n=1 Tax=Idiomarina sp. TaxID=1874361 RepID=UPI002611522E|nr:hypothetical protein [Idiomarina sp.]
MKKLLLHIGTGKTGSTTIQEAMAMLRDNGDLQGLSYPKIANNKHHNRLCTLVMPHERIRRDIKTKYPEENGIYKEFVERVESLFYESANESDNLVLSGEFFCGYTPDEIKKFKELLIGLGFSDIKVLLYFRDPCSLYLSQIQQRIKASSRFSNPYKYQFDYPGLYKRWRDEFEDVTVRHFDRSVLIGNDVVDDFLSVTNDYFGTSLRKPANLKPTNESLTVAGMLVQHDYRKTFYGDADNVMHPDSNRLVKQINRAEKELGYSNKPALRPELKRQIRANNENGVKWVRETLGIDLGLSEKSETNSAKRFRHNLLDIIKVTDEDLRAKELIMLSIVRRLLKK